MKRYVGCAVITIMVLLVIGCQGPEQMLLKKYFNAMQFQDKTTLGLMAVDPVTLNVSKWEIVSVGEETTKPAELKAKTQAEEDAKKQLEDLKAKGRETEGPMQEAEAMLKTARGKSKTIVQADYDAKKATYDAAVQKVKDAQKVLNLAKAETAEERKIEVLSVTEIPGIEEMEGEYRTKTVTVRLTLKKEDRSDATPKDYIIELRSYKLTNPATGRPARGKWILVKMAPVA